MKDSLVYEKSGLPIHVPGQDFILQQENKTFLQNSFPEKRIITPLYVAYDDFQNILKPDNFKAFYVTRDPRDILISRYFSVRYSHSMYTKSLQDEKNKLERLNLHEGIMLLIQMIKSEHSDFYSSMCSWINAGDDPRIKIYKFEEITGKNKFNTFKKLFNHICIDMDNDSLIKLLEKNSFMKISGREQGQEKFNSHYRKGVSGDWKNYFSSFHAMAFKRNTGDLLIKLGYEKSGNW